MNISDWGMLFIAEYTLSGASTLVLPRNFQMNIASTALWVAFNEYNIYTLSSFMNI